MTATGDVTSDRAHRATPNEGAWLRSPNGDVVVDVVVTSLERERWRPWGPGIETEVDRYFC